MNAYLSVYVHARAGVHAGQWHQIILDLELDDYEHPSTGTKNWTRIHQKSSSWTLTMPSRILLVLMRARRGTIVAPGAASFPSDTW